MLDTEAAHCASIIFRPIRLSDLEALEQIHAALFPIRYEREFFLDVVNRRGIISWAAVDSSRSDSRSGELIGFVTTRVIAAKESEVFETNTLKGHPLLQKESKIANIYVCALVTQIVDLFKYDCSRKDKTLVYILTLGVVERYRNLNIATSLVREVIKYASSITSCRAVYLHVIAYNQPAIHFYKKMLFILVRKLPKFYYIKGQHYDSYLFVYYVNGGRSPCSPLDIMTVVVAYFRGFFRSLARKLWKPEEKIPRWSKCKETSSLLITQNNRILGADNAVSDCV